MTLPESIQVFERGWLSSNNVLLVDDTCAALVDTGYATHASQTLALLQAALGERPLDLIVNTHLHSDHCGGNALLQAAWPCRTAIPASEATAVRDWDETRLTFRGTGQTCERFTFTETLAPGAHLTLGALDWEALGAPGHDPHSLMLYCAEERVLISADALWENRPCWRRLRNSTFAPSSPVTARHLRTCRLRWSGPFRAWPGYARIRHATRRMR
jgi:glyoxylase-like metal-dependent hydrolase (beta-lactamase superfamily II)